MTDLTPELLAKLEAIDGQPYNCEWREEYVQDRNESIICDAREEKEASLIICALNALPALVAAAKELDQLRADLQGQLDHGSKIVAPHIESLRAERDRLRVEVDRRGELISAPHTDNFMEGLKREAAHQIEHWGTEHDAGKRPEDWIALLAYLLGKALKAHYDRDADKLKHHIVTAAAAALNWHRAITGESTVMCPGMGTQGTEFKTGP